MQLQDGFGSNPECKQVTSTQLIFSPVFILLATKQCIYLLADFSSESVKE